ncbi:MAG: RbsD/FucU domain-containing protein [Acidobacteriota bacterium]|nr:RbsD/FucU domain-containing protein [Acidobacteriota bacterium]
MRQVLPLLFSTLAIVALASCRAPQKPASETPETSLAGPVETTARPWRDTLLKELPALGHRNWIVIADAAFPLQISPGMEIIVSGEDHFAVLDEVLKAVAAAKHLRPKVRLDKELDYVSEAMAPGMDVCRARIKERLAGLEVQSVLHEELISRLDQAAKTFKVVMIKTNLTLPYTTVFLELDCGYWGADGEAAMRQAMKVK